MALGAVQLTGMSAYGDLAVVPSVPAALGPHIALAVAPVCLRFPAVPVRIGCARMLLHRLGPAAADAVSALPDIPEADDLRGQLAEAQGHAADALGSYIRARDVERAQRLIDAIAQSAPERARTLEAALVAGLRSPADATVRARAWWRLGQLDQIIAAREPGRRDLSLASLDAYRNALAIAPNEETYLLAAGEQALTLGRRDLARRYYEQAVSAVPNSTDAQRGLQRSAP